MSATTLRRILCLNLIPNTKGITTKQLCYEIQQEFDTRCLDNAISEQNVLRDIKALQACGFAIVQRRAQGSPGNTNSCWTRAGTIMVAGMPKSVALALKLASEHLDKLMPAGLLDSLQPFFTLADEKLENSKNNKYFSWPEKVRTIPSGFQQLPADLEPAMVEVIYSQALKGEYFEATYTHIDGEKEKGRYAPLGIVNRAKATYVIVLHGLSNTPEQRTLHRFSDATPFGKRTKIPEDFDLDDYIDNNLGLRDLGHEKQFFRALITTETARHYEETPLDCSQVITPADRPGWHTITANLVITNDFSYFLLSYQQEVIVEQPTALRDWMVKKIAGMAKNYQITN